MGAGLAHEINNPLAGILGTTQLLRARGDDNALDEALATIEEQANRCREVVGQLLRLTERDLDSEPATVVDLSVILGDVSNLVQGPFRQRGVTLQMRDVGEALPVRADPVHASRIFAQILNTLRAGLVDGATLAVSGSVRGDEVVVRLAPDRGASDLSRDDFLASSMGLWVSRQLLDDMGGSLEEPDEQDAAWRVILPRGHA
jgi:signal transduction histidine kinase